MYYGKLKQKYRGDNMKYYFINHSFMGSNIENWLPWVKNNIDSENNLCIIPQYR